MSDPDASLILPAAVGRRRATALLLLCVWLGASATGSAQARRTLTVGWYPWDPYNYADEFSGHRRVTGLDVELTRAAMARSEYDLVFVQASWEEQMNALASGSQDLATGALPGDSRNDRATYSAPYRTETVVLFVPYGTASSHEPIPGDALATDLRERGFRLGASAGYSYGPVVDRLVGDLDKAIPVLRLDSEYDLYLALQAGRIDGFVADRLVATTIGWRMDLHHLIEEHPTRFPPNDVRLMIGAHVAPDVATAFDGGMQRLRSTGEYNRIVRSYVMPLLLSATVERPWFTVLNILATCALAVSGVILAHTGGFSIFGAFVLAALPSLGGGVLRDLMVARHPIGILRDPVLLLYVALTVAAGWLAIRFWPQARAARPPEEIPPWFTWTVTVCDAIGLGTLSVIGVLVAMDTRSEPLLLWGPLLGVTTTVGGGIMRDLVRGAGGLDTLKGSLYAEIAIVWGAALSGFFYWQASRIEPREIFLAVACCAAGATLTRIAAVFFRVTGPMLTPGARART